MNSAASIDQYLTGVVQSVRAGKAAAWALDEGTESAAVWERIEFHGIPVLLHENAGLLDGWPQNLTGRITEEARLAALWESTHRDTVGALLTALARCGIESVLMKGTALAYSLHDEPSVRRRGDSDLLVHPRHQEACRAVLCELGWYRKEDPHGLYYQEGWLHDAAGFFVHSLDLHWEVSDRSVLHPVLPFDWFFDRKEPLERLCEAAFRPDYAAMILHASVNQKWHAQHGYDAEGGRLASARRLIWSVDFDLMVRAMGEADWDELTRHCTAHGIGPLVAEALQGAAQDCGTPLPGEALEVLSNGALAPDLALYFSKQDSIGQFWLDLRKTRGIAGKWRLITMRAFPPRKHLIAKYPQASGWPTFALQARLLAGTAGRLVKRALP